MNRMQEIEIAKIDEKITSSLQFILLGAAGAVVAGILNILEYMGAICVRVGADSVLVYAILYVVSLTICLMGFYKYSKLLRLKEKIKG